MVALLDSEMMVESAQREAFILSSAVAGPHRILLAAADHEIWKERTAFFGSCTKFSPQQWFSSPCHTESVLYISYYILIAEYVRFPFTMPTQSVRKTLPPFSSSRKISTFQLWERMRPPRFRFSCQGMRELVQLELSKSVCARVTNVVGSRGRIRTLCDQFRRNTF